MNDFKSILVTAVITAALCCFGGTATAKKQKSEKNVISATQDGREAKQTKKAGKLVLAKAKKSKAKDKPEQAQSGPSKNDGPKKSTGPAWPHGKEISLAEAYNKLYGTTYDTHGIDGLKALVGDHGADFDAVEHLAKARGVRARHAAAADDANSNFVHDV